jgi:hypothetical protein
VRAEVVDDNVQQVGAIAETDDRPPICVICGVTMVPAALSADDDHDGEWVCLECEELGEER